MATQHAPSPKAAHYHQALSSALLRGAWSSSQPATAPNGTGLSWAELIRKWGKHTGGNTAIIHHLRNVSLLYLPLLGRPASLASHSHASSGPSSGVSARADPDGHSGGTAGSQSGSSFVHVSHPEHRTTAPLGRPISNIAGSSSAATARARDSHAYNLSDKDLDGDEPAEESSWEEGDGWWTGLVSGEVQEAVADEEGVTTLIRGGQLRPAEISTAKLLGIFVTHALGRHSDVVRMATDEEPFQLLRAGAVEGDAAILDRIRAKCVLGMSAELLPQPDFDLALRAYTSIIPLLRPISTYTFPLPSYLSKSRDRATAFEFERHREICRWLATALTRAAVIAARRSDVTESLRILRTYHAFSLSWPATFRSNQRQRMLLLYVRALHAGFPPSGSVCEHPYLISEGASPQPARKVWMSEVNEALYNGRRLLSSTTTFPKAGAVNAPVIAFANIIVALYDQCQKLGRSISDTLWWAMSLTFQSQSILRHLTRLLAALGDSADARRTFELYVQLVLKARETQQPDISLQLKRRPTEDVPAGPAEIAQQAEDAEDEEGEVAEERKSQIAEAELDGDDEFVEALLVGARLLLKDLFEADEAWRYVNLAGDVILNADKRRNPTRQSLRGDVEECKGIVRMAMVMQSADSTTRPTYQAQAINHLISAVKLNAGSATAFFHLAYCQAEARAIDAATDSIRQCLELDSQNLQAWHLVALLLTASGDWSGALKACDAGVSVWDESEANEDADEEGDVSTNPIPTDPAVETKDFATASSTSAPTSATSATERLLDTSGALRPVARSPALPVSRSKKLENVIRLRMTQAVIIERLQGPDAAMLQQQELFAFFSARSGRNRYNFGYHRNGLQNVASVMDLGGSYVSIAAPTTQDSGPPRQTPVNGNGPFTSVGAMQPAAATIGAGDVSEPPPVIVDPASGQTTPLDSGTASEGEVTDEKERQKRSVRRSFTGSRKAIQKHLHVPNVHRPSSIRRVSTLQEEAQGHGHRIPSASSSAASIAPTAVHSHFRGYTPRGPPPPPPAPRVEHGRTPLESRILSNLWLMSAATFRRWGKPEQSLVAIEEAETLDPENADVWVQLGLYHVSLENFAAALPAFTKSILLRPDHPPSIVSLSKLYLTTGQIELAHSLLNQLTQDAGWDVPEAWYYLAKVCEAQGRLERSRECLVYALDLEESKPCRRWRDAVDRWL